MIKEEWAKLININSECYKIIEQNTVSDFEKYKGIFWSDTNHFLEILKSGILNFQEILSLIFHISYDYKINSFGKDTSVFDNSMEDLQIWADDCYEKHGYYGLAQYNWLVLLIQKKVVRLGRLEFEPDTLKETVKIGEKILEKGTKVINVHIPAGKPLVYEECKESYKRCLEYYGLDSAIFQCESWLLSPLLDDMLKSSSNIIRFKSDFEIYKLDIMERLFEERIFGGPIYDNPMYYKAETSLQIKAKALLRKGVDLVGAWGIYFYEK